MCIWDIDIWEISINMDGIRTLTFAMMEEHSSGCVHPPKCIHKHVSQSVMIRSALHTHTYTDRLQVVVCNSPTCDTISHHLNEPTRHMQPVKSRSQSHGRRLPHINHMMRASIYRHIYWCSFFIYPDTLDTHNPAPFYHWLTHSSHLSYLPIKMRQPQVHMWDTTIFHLWGRINVQWMYPMEI